MHAETERNTVPDGFGRTKINTFIRHISNEIVIVTCIPYNNIQVRYKTAAILYVYLYSTPDEYNKLEANVVDAKPPYYEPVYYAI